MTAVKPIVATARKRKMSIIAASFNPSKKNKKKHRTEAEEFEEDNEADCEEKKR